MRSPLAWILIVCVVLMPAVTPASDLAFSAFAVIEITRGEADALSVTASVQALSDDELSATLVVDRKGKSGTISLRQERAVRLVGGERAAIGHITLSFTPGDSFVATAEVWRGDRLVARTRTETASCGD